MALTTAVPGADTRRMGTGAYLQNQLLVAMPSLADPNFSHSVTLVCEHNERGALGLVINRPLEMRMSEVLDQLSLETDDAQLRDMPVLAGGPVQRDRGFVLHRPGPQQWDSTMRVSSAPSREYPPPRRVRSRQPRAARLSDRARRREADGNRTSREPELIRARA